MCYLTQLSHWNRTINLTSIVDPQEIMIKHFIDSLMALTVLDFPRGAVLIDVGTGAGFPGVPLKIVRDDLRVTLIERIKKKCSFLTSIAGVLRLENLQVFQGTLLQYDEKADRQIANLVTVRAVNFRDICDSVVR